MWFVIRLLQDQMDTLYEIAVTNGLTFFQKQVDSTANMRTFEMEQTTIGKRDKLETVDKTQKDHG